MNKTVDLTLMRVVLDGVKPSINKSGSNRSKSNKYITDGKYMFQVDKMVSVQTRIEKLHNWIGKEWIQDEVSPRTITHTVCRDLFKNMVDKATEEVYLLSYTTLNNYSPSKYTACAQFSRIDPIHKYGIKISPEDITLVDIKYLSLCWSHLKFDSAKVDPDNTACNALVLYKNDEPVGLLMPIRRKEDT